MKNILCILALTLLVAIITSCGGGGSSVGSISQPTPSGAVTANVAMEKVALASAESTTITAIIMAGGAPVAGSTVSFSTTIGKGTLDSSTAVTDANGIASVKLTAATTTGVAEVTVSATVNSTPVSKTMPYYINMPPLQLSTPASKSIDAGTTTTISVNILDANGAPYTAQDVNVYFDSHYGGLGGNNFYTYRTRSSGGVASVTYRASAADSQPITDTITINLGTSTVTTYITILPAPLTSIAFTSALSPAAATRLLPNTSVTLYFKVSDAAGIARPNQKVNFSLSSALSGSTVTASATTNIAGYALATLKTGAVAGAGVSVVASIDGTSITAVSDVYTIASPPVAVALPTAAAGAATTIDVTFTAPADDGGSPVTGYTVTSLPAGGVDSNAGSTSLTHHITGLTTGVSYTFTVIATNAIGNSPASPPSVALPAP